MPPMIYHFEVFETETLLELQASLIEKLEAVQQELFKRTGVTEEMLRGS